MSDRLVVRAMRGRSPDTWTYTLDEFSIAEHGFTDREVMANLIEAVRGSVQEVLTSARKADPRRELALRQSLADEHGRLEELLTEALLLEDERVERLLREHGEEPRD